MIGYKQLFMMFCMLVYGTSAFSQTKKVQSFSFSKSEGYNRIPFNYINDRIYIPATIEDSVRCNLFLDSGSKTVLLDSTFVEKNKKQLSLFINPQPNNSTTPDGTRRFYQTLFVWEKGQEKKQNQKIQINNAVVFEEHPAVADYRGDAYGKGVLPLALLAKNKIVNIHIKEKKMALLDRLDNKSDSIHFEIEPYTSAPLIKTEILLHDADTSYLLKGSFLLDLGFRGDLMLSESILEKQLKGVPYYEFVYASSAIGNTSSVKESYNLSLKIDNIQAENIRITYVKKMPPNIIGVIGIIMLKHINFALDYRNCFFHYHMQEPFIQNKAHSINKKDFGIFFMKQSSLLYIGTVRKGGKADLSGVKPFDKIIQVNDDFVTIENCDSLSRLSYVKKIVVQQKSGKKITLQK